MQWLVNVLPVIAIVVSIASLLVSRRQRVEAARSELLAYLTQIVSLDRAASRRNGHLVSALGQQCDLIIQRYGQRRLMLSPTTYRMLGEYLMLDTDELPTASKLLERGSAVAVSKGNDLELIRCTRTLGEIAGNRLDLASLERNIDEAVRLASEKTRQGQPAIGDSKQRTLVFGVLAALLAHENGGGEGAIRLARRYMAEGAAAAFPNLLHRDSLEVARRAHRIKGSLPDEFAVIKLADWQAKWHERNRPAAG